MAKTKRPEPDDTEPETPADGATEPSAEPEPDPSETAFEAALQAISPTTSAGPEPDGDGGDDDDQTGSDTDPHEDDPSDEDDDLPDDDQDDDQDADDDLDDDLSGRIGTPTPWPALLGAEVFGTFLLVLAGLGTALYAGLSNPNTGVSSLNGGPIAVSLAFGLALAAGVAAFGHVSGGHFNPAVTLGAALAGRLDWVRVLPYWVAQIVGGALAALMLFVTVPKLPSGYSVRQFFSSTANGFDHAATAAGAHSPIAVLTSGAATVSMLTALIIEAVVTAALVGVILAVTHHRANPTTAPLAIGGTLALGLMVTMPLTNGSLNPARSLAAAVFSQSWAFGQLWVFWVGPLFGAVVAGLAARLFVPPEQDAPLR